MIGNPNSREEKFCILCLVYGAFILYFWCWTSTAILVWRAHVRVLGVNHGQLEAGGCIWSAGNTWNSPHVQTSIRPLKPYYSFSISSPTCAPQDDFTTKRQQPKPNPAILNPRKERHPVFSLLEEGKWMKRWRASVSPLWRGNLPPTLQALCSPICGPLTVGAMYRTSWAPFKIGAQLTLQVPVPKY